MKTRPLTLLVLLLVAAMPLSAQRSAESERICYALDSHDSQRECLSSRAAQSETRLEAEEAFARSALLHADEDEADRARAVQALDKSAGEYRRYRKEQCEFVASLAFGGNAQEDRRLLCEIELNESRIRQLQAEVKHAV